MTWKSLHNRGALLRTVTEIADARMDGRLPMDLDGVRETFGDELTLLGALQLRWHTRLSGRIERELMSQPMDLESAVVTAWREVAAEMPGTRAIIDQHRAEPLDEPMAAAMRIATHKEHLLLAVMAGRTSAPDERAARVGAEIEERARVGFTPVVVPVPRDRDGSLIGRLRAALAAA